jgi:hypothetical protein
MEELLDGKIELLQDDQGAIRFNLTFNINARSH